MNDCCIPVSKMPGAHTHLPYGRELTSQEKEDLHNRRVEKARWQKVMANAQALEQEAYRRKMQRLRAEAGNYEDEPA